MAERTKERESEQDVDELLAETEQLLGDIDDGPSGPSDGPDTTGSDTGTAGTDTGTDGGLNVSGVGVNVSDTPPSAEDDDGGILSRFGNDSTSATGTADASTSGGSELLSLRSLLVSLVVLTAGLFVGSAFIPVIGGLAGMFGVGFLLGLLRSRSAYVETGLAGLAVGGLGAVMNNLVVSLSGIGVPIAAVGAAGGLLAALVGTYFGRDLRTGLTQDLNDL